MSWRRKRLSCAFSSRYSESFHPSQWHTFFILNCVIHRCCHGPKSFTITITIYAYMLWTKYNVHSKNVHLKCTFSVCVCVFARKIHHFHFLPRARFNECQMKRNSFPNKSSELDGSTFQWIMSGHELTDRIAQRAMLTMWIGFEG